MDIFDKKPINQAAHKTWTRTEDQVTPFVQS